MPTEQSLRQFVQLAAIGIVVIGCYRVLLPFIPAILFAVVVCISTWPLYERLRRVLRGKTTLAALAQDLNRRTPWNSRELAASSFWSRISMPS